MLEIEVGRAVATQQLPQAFLAAFLREGRPIERLRRDARLPRDELHRSLAAAPVEAHPQGVASGDDVFERTDERRRWNGLAQAEEDLLDLHAALRRAETVEEHPFLHRRER